MNEDGSPIVNPEAPKTPEAPNYSSPNDLDFEMTAEQEQDYVNQILNNGDYTPPKDDIVNDSSKRDDKEETEELPKPPVEEVEKPEVPPQGEVTAPQTDDLWIEVERVVTNDLDEETTETIKLVYDPSDPSSFIPDDFTAKSTKQLAEIMDAKNEMEKIYDGRRKEFEDGESKKEAAQQEKNLVDGWDAEIKDLVDSGVLPDKDKDPKDFQEKTDAVYAFMAKKNADRIDNGIPPISSFGTAFTMYQNDADRKAAEEAEKKDNEETKRRGAMVGGGSAASGGSPEKATYTSGKYKSIYDVPIKE